MQAHQPVISQGTVGTDVLGAAEAAVAVAALNVPDADGALSRVVLANLPDALVEGVILF